ncbi:MAG: DUF1343 domain-containing protein [Rikenellaceae bacterium]
MKTIFFLFLAFTITVQSYAQEVVTGAEQLEEYFPLLKNRRVGFMGNQTSVVGKKHLVDVLIEKGITVQFAFAPEHGFRGDIERGEKFGNTRDQKTGIPIYTLYGGNTQADSIISSVDCMIFDIQDVGARFYTYITSLHRVMQLCADHHKKLIILDRPNPNGDQVDGPVRKNDQYKSDVSYHKIAMIHGLTIAELAQMINGEKWLDKGVQCDLHIVKVKNYTHNTLYRLPVIPSPSLTNHLAVRLYTSLCLFEGTEINIGRGTDHPFQMIGYPNPLFGKFTFVPLSKAGMSAHVENQGKQCYGIDLRNLNGDDCRFTLKYLLDFYQKSKQIKGFNFFSRPDFFNKLAGNAELQEQIKAGMNERQIRATWQKDLDAYRSMRKKYLLYD